jgi:hypothetical protein
MNTLIINRDYIPILKQQMQEEGLLYMHHLITNNTITDDCISIVMTASNRSAQTYYTLKTIAASSIKNVQVILIDDSTVDPCLVTDLEQFPLYINFITINREKKLWVNPCINYNIGFRYIKGNKIIIQNAEVCYSGDVLADLSKRIQINDNSYYVYDIITVRDFAGNKVLHETPLDYNMVSRLPIYGQWYQSKTNNRNMHFLVGLSKETLKKINCEFSYDYTFAFGWDDDDLLLKIIAANINIVNIHVEGHNLLGIHQYHTLSPLVWGIQKELGKTLYEKKKLYYDSSNVYLDLTINNNSEFDTQLDLLMRAT